MPNKSIPLQTPWDLFPSPEILDTLLVEIVDRDVQSYRRIPPGSPHPDRSKFPGCRRADEKPIEGSENLVRRFWASDPTNQDAYNYGIEYESESASHPKWARRYIIRRDQYTPATYGAAFTGAALVGRSDGPLFCASTTV